MMFMERTPGSHQLFVRVLLIMSVVGLSESRSLFVRVVPIAIASMEGAQKDALFLLRF